MANNAEYDNLQVNTNAKIGWISLDAPSCKVSVGGGRKKPPTDIGRDGELSVLNNIGDTIFHVTTAGLEAQGSLSINQATVNGQLDVSGPLMVGADASTGEGGVRMNGDQGGAIELGNSHAYNAIPYIDFHFGVGKAQDYNTRIINDADRRLTIDANLLHVSGAIRGGSLEVGGAIIAGNSDLYFTKTDHNHTAFGNFDKHPGFAAIENAQDYGALMILGRSTTNGRIVQLWDYLRVNGSLYASGTLGAENTIHSGKPLTPNYAESISVAQSDAKLLLYDYGGDNWAGIGVDTAGLIWIRTGTAGQNLIRIGPGGLEMVNGDIILTNADCAEDFSVADPAAIEPGTVMVIDHGSMLKASDRAYDKRVAGVISGAGDLKPGITLGKQPSQDNRLPLALAGKVYCKVDAQYGPIDVGDLLTSSSTLGHAMKATDPAKSFGAVIGKALGSLAAGTGLIPIIVALQ